MTSSINSSDFAYLCDLLKQRSGLNLGEDKKYLVDSRLMPIIRKHAFIDVSAMVNKIKSTQDEEIITEIVEAMTTNETSFFRDRKPFEKLRENVVPHVLSHNRGENPIRIWCAACSTGQEPYSIVMDLLEHPACLEGRKFEILATDIDRSILERAKKGEYTQFEVQRGLPVTLLLKYFTQEGEEKWRVKDELKAPITFKQGNLLDDVPGVGSFDIIFCRNVLIYFDPLLKSSVLGKLATALKPHGVLFLGSAETVTDLSEKLETWRDKPGLFGVSK